MGSPAAVADGIEAFLSRGLDTLIIGLADPDPKQLDLLGEKVLPYRYVLKSIGVISSGNLLLGDQPPCATARCCVSFVKAI